MPKKASKARKHRTLVKTASGQRYLKRNAKGQIVDNQSAKRARSQDARRRAKAERH